MRLLYPTPYNTGRRGICHSFRLTDKTETIIGKANKRRPIKDKIEVGHDRRRRTGEAGDEVAGVRIDGGIEMF